MPASLRLAVRLLTAAPLRPGREDPVTAHRALAWVPLLAAAIALPVLAVQFVTRLIFVDVRGPLLPATLALLTLALVTGGRNLTGLASFADGLTGPAGTAHERMRSVAAGRHGQVAMLFTLLLQVFAAASCIAGHRGTESMLLAILTGRVGLLWCCRRGLAAAPGAGAAGRLAGGVTLPLAAAWTAALLVEAVTYGRFDQDAGSPHSAVRALLAAAAGLAVAFGARTVARRRFGGLTLALPGAVAEATQAVVLLVMALQLPYDLHW